MFSQLLPERARALYNLATMQTFSTTDLNQLIHDVYRENQRQYADRPLTLHFRDQSRSACAVPVHEDDLRHVVMNLVSNAIKGSGERGDIFLELQQQGWKCALEVLDFGPTNEPRDFNSVTQTLRRFQGSISVESHQYKGNRVRIELPLLNS